MCGFFTSEVAVPPLVAFLRTFADEECNRCYANTALVIIRMLSKPCRTQESGDSGTRFEDRACPKPRANKSANVGGLRGIVGVSMHDGRHLFYLGVCIPIEVT